MYVINLDFPKLIEDYVHRIGRCGRCDRMGISYAFFTRNDAKQAQELIAILNEANQVFSKNFFFSSKDKKNPTKTNKNKTKNLLSPLAGGCQVTRNCIQSTKARKN